MPRFSFPVLVGLMLASSSWAQDPAGEAEVPTPTADLPSPTPASPRLLVRELGAKLGDNFELPIGALVPPPGPDDWHFWASADYAFAWIRGKSLPPLATTSPPGTAQGAAGVLGVASTSVLIGGEPITQDLRSMGRLNFGMWFGPDKQYGVAAGAFVTDSKGTTFVAASDGSTIIARPFTDAATGTPTAVLTAYPGISSGSVNVSAAMQTFCGANLDFAGQFCSFLDSGVHVNALIGYRYLHYGESLAMQQTLNATGGAFMVPGTQIVSSDSFQTTNNFHGCEVGLHSEIAGERWSLGLLTKLAAGDLRREIMINGSTLATVPGVGAISGLGGIYAQSSNIGNYFHDSFVVAPELGLDFSYEVCAHVRLPPGLFIPVLAGSRPGCRPNQFHPKPKSLPARTRRRPQPARVQFGQVGHLDSKHQFGRGGSLLRVEAAIVQ